MFFPFISGHTFQLAWLMATAFSTIGNYIGQKYWVFRAKVTTDQQNLSEGTRHQLE
jgi:putative flippase GtrA